MQSQPISHSDQSTMHSPASMRATLARLKAVREPWLKRPLDFVLASMMLTVSAPVWLLIALSIRLEDGGPVFYRQQRWGRGGTTFAVRKFRTMVPDSDRRYGITQAKEHDSRITRVGRFLRATGMDELPQLLSIWKGDMSFVGPRALAVGEKLYDGTGDYLTYEHIRGFSERMAVRPGLTGIATIYIPKDASPHRKFRYDLLYIRHQSFLLDIKLILLSFWISFRGKWEARGKKM